MSAHARPFNWRLFHRRMLGAYVVIAIWLVRDARSHQYWGLLFAMMTAVAISAFCYVWVRNSA